ncbi:MAG: hypothetical protein ACLPX5_05280 [Dissulfurispiraceae bacterium]
MVAQDLRARGSAHLWRGKQTLQASQIPQWSGDLGTVQTGVYYRPNGEVGGGGLAWQIKYCRVVKQMIKEKISFNARHLAGGIP